MFTALLALHLANASLPVLPVAPHTVSGWGRRGDFTVAGQLTRTASEVTGDFVILVYPSTSGGSTCRYKRFANVKFVGDTVTFDAWGVCTTMPANGALVDFRVHNAFSFVDAGPGGTDTMDVNMYGANGITVPGGTLDSGAFDVQ